MNGWKSYFDKLLNNNTIPDEEENKITAGPELPINVNLFSEEELLYAIKSLKNGKSPGIDSDITSEIVKYGGTQIKSVLLKICNKVYTDLVPPKQWTTNIIIPIPKKGDIHKMSNFRGICLMSTGAKLFNRMLLNRIYEHVNPRISITQAGFRRKMNCVQQINTLRMIIESMNDKNLPLIAS